MSTTLNELAVDPSAGKAKNAELMRGYVPLTTESRVRDIEIPEKLFIGGREVELPRALRRKDVHYLLDAGGRPVRACWLHRALGHLLNSWREELPEEAKTNEVLRAIDALDDTLNDLVKEDVLKDRHGPGFMAFVQSNENVPEDAILLSERSWALLCKHRPVWERAERISLTRFPNLGPGTTVELRVIVNRDRPLGYTPPNSLFNVAHGPQGQSLRELFADFLEEDEGSVEPDGVFDAAYLHPSVLKGKLEGDGDGDQVYGLLKKLGRTHFERIDMTRKPAPLSSLKEEEATLFRKAARVERRPLPEHLPSLFDDTPIGQATYAIRKMLYDELVKHRDASHPMHDAWQVIGPEGNTIMETVMDIRKGDFTEEEIQALMDFIVGVNESLREAQAQGDAFACTVTSRRVTNVAAFVEQFPRMQEFLDLVTGQDFARRGLASLLGDPGEDEE